MSKIQKKLIQATDGTSISVYFITPTSTTIKGVLFAPPLMGGSYLEQYKTYFNVAADSGYILVSFNYRGHKKAEGKFSVRTSITDSLQVARFLKSEFPDLCLYGIGICYSVIPLFYVISKEPFLFNKLILVNSLSRKRLVVTWPLILNSFFEELLTPKNFRINNVLSRIASKVLPEVNQSQKHFGQLLYENLNGYKFLIEYTMMRLFFTAKGVEIPTFCCYGVKDEKLGLTSDRHWLSYEKEMSRYCKKITFLRLQDDHYFTKDAAKVNNKIVNFIETQ